MNEILRFMQKHDRRTHGRKAFYNLPTTAFGHRREIIMGKLHNTGIRLGMCVSNKEMQ